ncbi:MAG TPA: zinc-binding dehydrogenase [Ilumatobacteraceae bacterium]|nr:zinc-binding dehydrogenase [Ilumatobacteraceae bacterium]
MGSPTTMTAAVTFGHGGPDQIEVRASWPCPEPEVGQALVRVTAAALNNTDIWSREGAYGTAADPDAVVGWKGVPLDFPRIQGIDVAGEVVAVGSVADDHWIGKRVIVDSAARYEDGRPVDIVGSEVDGGFAEFHVCSVRQLHDVTASPLTDAQLACLPTAYGTALGMLTRADIESGERVLVTGASGGVGMAAVQLLLDRGCEVVARTSAPHRALIAGFGVADVSVRGVDDLTELQHVDVVVDVVGGDEFGAALDRVRDGGRLVTAGAIAGPVVAFDLRRLYLPQRTLIGSTMHTPTVFARLAEIATVGGVQPLLDATYPLPEIATAQARFVVGDFVGKLVLLP